MTTSSATYTPAEIEAKWQHYWLERKTFKAVDGDPTRPKLYVLDMFPYPSGAGLHVGHPEGYTATDIVCRYKRMKGFNVLHTMGWDAFGLPAEQYAVETGTHPAVTTQKNINRFRQQLQSFGFSYDWDREIDTTDPKYYKWTQWIFTQLYKKGLAYKAEVPVNWCPALGTVLANEEVIDGHSERGNHPVVRQPMKQWMLRITQYAERLLDEGEALDWPAGTKEMQRNWIGKSTGAEVDFLVAGRPEKIRVFTTRPDTLFGATYMVLAPEHALVSALTTPAQQAAVAAYQLAAKSKSDMDRTEAKDKTGVDTGARAINPVNGEEIPIWISDYVLISYGHGAIMAVPAHDTRDFEFACKFELPIRPIIEPTDAWLRADGVFPKMEDLEKYFENDSTALNEWVQIANSVHAFSSPATDQEAQNSCQEIRGKYHEFPFLFQSAYTADGSHINSANDTISLNGISSNDEAIDKMVDWLQKYGAGQRHTQFKLRDWLFSRQRYWGEPFPVAHLDDGTEQLMSDAELPVLLPELADFKPTGTLDPPLSKAKEWLAYTDPGTGRKGLRETNTMPQWAGSCWYYLRFTDPHNDQAAWDPAKEKYWMPVDLYVGGAEHAVLHLLYARFWHKVLFDLGYVSTPEPFKKLVHQGLILGISYKDGRGFPVANDKVAHRDGSHFHLETGEELVEYPTKMSKSLKNVVNPDEIVGQYGADAFRMYEMFMGPLTDAKPWNTAGVEGVYRFLHRAWKMIVGPDGALAPQIQDAPLPRDQERLLHQTIKKVGDDYEAMSFNTAISQLMIFVNEFGKCELRNRQAMAAFVQLLSPMAPHIAEELWQRLGHADTLAYAPWPAYDEEKLKLDTLEIVVQVNGKPRGKITVAAGADAVAVEAAAQADPKVQEHLAGKTVVKVITVPGRLVNLVAR